MTYAKPNYTAGAGGGGGGDTKKITNARGVEDFVAISDNKGSQLHTPTHTHTHTHTHTIRI
jgi:hypothetical protein